MTRLTLATLPGRLPVLDVRAAKPAPKRAASIYTSTEWRALMSRLIQARGRRCEAPGCARTGCRIFGDHIVELQDGGAPLDPQNVMLMCGACHTQKTIAARTARQAATHVPKAEVGG